LNDHFIEAFEMESAAVSALDDLKKKNVGLARQPYMYHYVKALGDALSALPERRDMER